MKYVPPSKEELARRGIVDKPKAAPEPKAAPKKKKLFKSKE